MPYTFLTGGARSGKSAAAERCARASGSEVTVVATGQPLDDEMTARILRHQASRPAAWATVEEPVAVAEAIAAAPGDRFLLVDCLTLWLANVLALPDDDILRRADCVVAALTGRPGDAVVVSNEVGDGIVPADPATRRYRDLLGVVNAKMAASATQSFLVVAGRFVALEAPRW